MSTAAESGAATLFLCGDVMTGRGIDQILAHPGRPELFEPYVHWAPDYVELAERESGKIAFPVDDAYIWGDALAVLDEFRPSARIINLETAVTASDEPWPGKSIHYRMHPANIGALAAARPDCCVLANNHVLDWGRRGLEETLETLAAAGLPWAGAGRNRAEAEAPACIPLGDRRLLVFAYGVESSGVPPEWAATDERSGVTWLADLSPEALATILATVAAHRKTGDLVAASIHWGGNWRYAVTRQERHFAHQLVDGGVDLVHGHSSHHPKGIEVYRDRLVIYGCGDFLNDYEGIGSYRSYRPDLALMYFPILDGASGRLLQLSLVPMRISRLSVNRAPEEGVAWLQGMLDREGLPFGTRVDRSRDRLVLRWQ
ncbi:MAG: poly-gamma-glutamate biosynthesis protein [Rhodocyclaceae bacterium]|nr:poly-gamma-glutamate biosynthesis protein [Rhodocyclaceae bacterium]